MPAARDGVVFSVRDPLYRVLAIGLAGCIIGADSLNNLLPRVVQCVAEWGTSPVGCRHARVQLIFLYPFAVMHEVNAFSLKPLSLCAC